MAQKVAIGIDLGTSKCCVGVVRDGKVEIIENDRGAKTTPNYVAFTDVETLTGTDAKDQAASNPSHTVYGVKRLIGRNIHSESRLKKELKSFPFDVRHKSNGRLGINVNYKQTARTVSPEQITALMLIKLKEMAESHLGCPVSDAVVSVPNQFNDNQRRATVNASRMAGLNLLSLINEPTAAALAYIDGKTFVRMENLLVFDLGDGSLNVSVVRVGTENVEVRAIGGDLRLGGSDFDVKLMDHCINHFYKKNGDQVKLDSKAYSKLKLACEEAKHTLALIPKTNVHVESLIGEVDFDCSISRKLFEETCLLNSLERAEKLIKEVLNDAKLGKSEIDQVVLIGGSTRIPCVQKMLQEFFDGKELNKTVNANEGVAFGAAIQAAILGGNHTISDVRISDIVQNPLYWKKSGKPSDSNGILKFIKIHQHNKEKEFLVEVSAVAFNQFKNVHTSHAIDLVGLHITSHFLSATKKDKISFCGSALAHMEGLLSEEDISVMSSEVKQFIVDNKKQTQFVIATTKLESFCFKVKDVLEKQLSSCSVECDIGDSCSGNAHEAVTLKQPCEDSLQNEKNLLENCCNEVLDWLEQSHLCSMQDCQQKQDQLFSLCKRSGLSYLCENENTKAVSSSPNSETQKENTSKKRKNKKRKSKGCNKQLNSLNEKNTNTSIIEKVKKYTKFSNKFVHKWKIAIDGLKFEAKVEPNIYESKKESHDSLVSGNICCNNGSSGVSVEQLDSSGVSVEQLGFSGVSVEQLGSSGVSVEQLGSSGILEQIGPSGDSLEQIGPSGDSLEQIGSSGESLEPICSSGESLEQIGSSGESLKQIDSSEESLEPLSSSRVSLEPLHSTFVDAACLEMSGSAANKMPSSKSSDLDGIKMSSTLSSGSTGSKAGDELLSIITSKNAWNNTLDSTGGTKESSAIPEIIMNDLKHLILTDVARKDSMTSAVSPSGDTSQDRAPRTDTERTVCLSNIAADGGRTCDDLDGKRYGGNEETHSGGFLGSRSELRTVVTELPQDNLQFVSGSRDLNLKTLENIKSMNLDSKYIESDSFKEVEYSGKARAAGEFALGSVNDSWPVPPVPVDRLLHQGKNFFSDKNVCISLQEKDSLSGHSLKIPNEVIENHDRQSHHHLQSQPSQYEPKNSRHYPQSQNYSQSQPSRNRFYQNGQYSQSQYNHQSQDQVQYSFQHQYRDQYHQLQGNRHLQMQNRTFEAQLYDQSQYLQHQSNNYQQTQNHYQNQINPWNKLWYPPTGHPHQSQFHHYQSQHHHHQSQHHHHQSPDQQHIQSQIRHLQNVGPIHPNNTLHSTEYLSNGIQIFNPYSQ